MERESPEGIDIDFDEGGDEVIPNPDEQLPLQVCSSENGCFVYDAHGAEISYWDKQHWERDPQAIVWMVERMQEAYERPRDALADAASREPMVMFYDADYPTDDTSHKGTVEAAHGPPRELPALDGREPINPQASPLTVETDDHYAENDPSIVRIRDGDTTLNEWHIQHSDDGAANARLGAEVAWHVRLAYERPWELRDGD